MAILSSLATIATIIGAGVGVAGAVVSYVGAKRAEALRLKQLNLQVARERRQTIRESIINRARAANAAAGAGIEGSGLSGGLANIQSQAGSNLQGGSQAAEIGVGMFKANNQISLGQTLSSLGAGISNFGSAFSGPNQETSGRLSRYYGFSAA